MKVVAAALVLAATSGCVAVVTSRPLASRVPDGDQPLGFYVSTGDAPYPYETVGFVQLNAYGAMAAGYVEVGDAALTTVLNQRLLQAAGPLGGQGVIFIEFEDPSAPTEADRMSQAAEAASSMFGSARSNASGSGVKERVVVVTGQVIRWRTP